MSQLDWTITEAKAKLSELIRRARTGGPQTITSHAEPIATITALPRSSRAKKRETGASLIAMLQSCPHPEVFEEVERQREESRKFNDYVNGLIAKDEEEQRLRDQQTHKAAQ